MDVSVFCRVDIVDLMSQSKTEEAAFWILQAMVDGRRFYFNTLTGVTTMELPSEPSSERVQLSPFAPPPSRSPPEFLISWDLPGSGGGTEVGPKSARSWYDDSLDG